MPESQRNDVPQLNSRLGLDDPAAVLHELRDMAAAGARAHNAASEGGLTGPVRDLLFGMNTAIDAITTLIGPPE